MNPGGIYVIEDTQTSYWPEYDGSTTRMLEVAFATNYFIDRIHGVNREEWRKGEQPPDLPAEGIDSIAFYHNLILVTKRTDRPIEC